MTPNKQIIIDHKIIRLFLLHVYVRYAVLKNVPQYGRNFYVNQ